MRKRILLILTLVITQLGYSQSQDSGDDCSLGETYYANSKTYIYEGMNTNSTVIAEVTEGGSVGVVSKFFGDHGWWKVCYNGIIGNSEKKCCLSWK